MRTISAFILLLVFTSQPAQACYEERLITRVLGWTQDGKLLVERRRSDICAGCVSAYRALVLEEIDPARKSIKSILLASWDLYQPMYSLVDPAEELKPWDQKNARGSRADYRRMRKRYLEAKSWWKKHGRLAARRLTDPVAPSCVRGQYTIQVHLGGDELACHDKKSVFERASVGELGELAISISRKGKTIKLPALKWKPSCHEPGCSTVATYFSPDGTRLAIVAGPQMARRDPEHPRPGHDRPGPATVFVFDLKTSKITRSQGKF